jgi:NAD(P)H dehydrogenase (quinone)
MHIYVVFAHPSKESFSNSVLEAFIRGLEDAGHSYEIADLYRMDFKSEMDARQYHRDLGSGLSTTGGKFLFGCV